MPPAALIASIRSRDLVGAVAAVLIVEAVGGAVGRGDVELHQVDMLADDVGRRADLEIVELVIAGQEVGKPVLDDVAAVGAEEQRLGRAPARKHVAHVSPERRDPLLGVVPALLVEDDVELDVGGLVRDRMLAAAGSRSSSRLRKALVGVAGLARAAYAAEIFVPGVDGRVGIGGTRAGAGRRWCGSRRSSRREGRWDAWPA